MGFEKRFGILLDRRGTRTGVSVAFVGACFFILRVGGPLSWDEAVVPVSVQEFKHRLREGAPRLIYDGTTVRTRQLRAGEERLVVVRELFAKVAAP